VRPSFFDKARDKASDKVTAFSFGFPSTHNQAQRPARRRATRLDERIDVAGFGQGIEVEHCSAGDAKVGYDAWVFAPCLVLKEASVATTMVFRFDAPVVAHGLRPLVCGATLDILGREMVSRIGSRFSSFDVKGVTLGNDKCENVSEADFGRIF